MNADAFGKKKIPWNIHIPKPPFQTDWKRN